MRQMIQEGPSVASNGATTPRNVVTENPQASILLVDDHAPNLLALEAILSSLGHTLVRATSGDEALRALLDQDFAVILMDVQMPGLDGFEVARLIKNRPRTREIPIIFITAIHREAQHIFKGYAHGAVDYLLKPFDPDILRSKVSVFVDLYLKRLHIERQAEQIRAHERTSLELRLEHRFRALTDMMPVCLWVARPDGRVYYSNRSWREFSGLSTEESADLTALSVIHADDSEPFSQAWHTALEGQAPLETEVRLLSHRDQLYRWHLLRAVPEHDEGASAVGWIITAMDIDDQKRADTARARAFEAERRAREQAEIANRSKDEFLATVSHELRTPLNAILGWARMLRSGMLDASKHARALETIERNAQVQTELIEDILDVSRIVSGKLRLRVRRMSAISIATSAIETVRPAAEAKGVELSAHLDPAADETTGDPDRLQQVVWNLLSNAIKFTPAGGKVEVKLAAEGDELELRVSDTGKGIPPDFLPFVFDRFRQVDSVSTRTEGGLGLGLAIVRHLVELHGGRVRAESLGDGQGATFVVRLPRRLVDVPSAEQEWMSQRRSPSTNTDSARLDGLRVLFVDDQEDARLLVQELLELCGAQVIAVGSVGAAMEWLAQERFDVLVSDIGLPDEDGYSLIRRVRALPAEQGGQMPAIAVTGFARAEDGRRALAEGFQNHLAKPVEPSELVSLIGALAGRLPAPQ